MRMLIFTVMILFPLSQAYAAQDNCPVVEVGIGKLRPQADQTLFLKDSRNLGLHLKQMKGFISRQFYRIESTNQWMDIVCWRSEGEAKKAAEEVHKIPACNSYLGHYNDKPDLFVHGVAHD